MGILIVMAVAALITYLLSNWQIKGWAYQIDRAQARLKDQRHNQGDQNDLDHAHIPLWASRIVRWRLARAWSRNIGLASLAAYLLMTGYAWARFFGWVG